MFKLQARKAYSCFFIGTRTRNEDIVHSALLAARQQEKHDGRVIPFYIEPSKRKWRQCVVSVKENESSMPMVEFARVAESTKIMFLLSNTSEAFFLIIVTRMVKD